MDGYGNRAEHTRNESHYRTGVPQLGRRSLSHGPDQKHEYRIQPGIQSGM
jgi:hypothetical protein